MLLGVTFEGVLFWVFIVGLVVGVTAWQIFMMQRRISQWRSGHAPGHDSYFELPYKRDDAFAVAQDVLVADYELSHIARIERLVLGLRPVGRGRHHRVTVRVEPTLSGSELIFSYLGPGWRRFKAGTNTADAERFCGEVMARLAAGATAASPGGQAAQPQPYAHGSAPEPGAPAYGQPGPAPSGGGGVGANGGYA